MVEGKPGLYVGPKNDSPIIYSPPLCVLKTTAEQARMGMERINELIAKKHSSSDHQEQNSENGYCQHSKTCKQKKWKDIEKKIEDISKFPAEIKEVLMLSSKIEMPEPTSRWHLETLNSGEEYDGL